MNFEEIWKLVSASVVAYGLRIVTALAIFVVGRWVALGIRGVVERVLEKRQVDPTIAKFLTELCYIALLTFVIIAAVGELGVQTASLVAVIGAAGLAVGLALQGTLGNFASGFLLILFRPFKRGDVIHAAGVEGAVEEIQVFTTTLVTGDNKKIIVPNSKLTGDNITNYTAMHQRRADVPLAVHYREDLGRVQSILLEIAAADPRILKSPAPEVAVTALGDPGVHLELRVWCKTADFGAVRSDTTAAVKRTLQAQGISFPERALTVLQRT